MVGVRCATASEVGRDDLALGLGGGFGFGPDIQIQYEGLILTMIGIDV